MTRLLEQQVVFVSGGSRGVGAAICRTFAAHGADVAFNYTSDEAGAAATVAAVEAAGRRALAHRVSVLDEAGLATAAAQTRTELGPLQILVNNAGISQPLPLALMDRGDWEKVLSVNVGGCYHVTRAFIPQMIRQRQGVILNIGSLAGLRLIKAPIHYSASKAAVKGFSDALCKEMSRYQIRVNCLAPGLLDDGVGQALPEHRFQEYVEHVAMRRPGTLDEVAQFAAFLCSSRNSYMNGATIMMDGGL